MNPVKINVKHQTNFIFIYGQIYVITVIAFKRFIRVAGGELRERN